MQAIKRQKKGCERDRERMEEIDRVCARERITKRDVDREKKREVVRQREGEEVSQKLRRKIH